jgi:hypothetical protein
MPLKALLLLLIASTANAASTSASSTRSFVVDHRYGKVMRALMSGIDLDDCELESVAVMLPPAVEVRGRSWTTVKGHRIELGAVVTLVRGETLIAIRLLRPVGPVAYASGTLSIQRVGKKKTRLTVRLNLHVSVRGGPIIGIIARRRTCREACEATCTIQRELERLCREHRVSISSVLETVEALLEAGRSSMK